MEEKITPVEQEKSEYSFTCQKCGSHSFTEVVSSTHKFGGPGITPSTVKVCRNCGWGEEGKE